MRCNIRMKIAEEKLIEIFFFINADAEPNHPLINNNNSFGKKNQEIKP